MNTEHEALAAATVSSFKALIGAALAPISEQLRAIGERLDALPTPRDGRDGEPGAKGADGVSIDVDAVLRDVEKRVGEFLGAIEPPKDGKDGRDGADGADGVSVDVAAVVGDVKKQVTDFLAAIPEPRDGRDGIPGEPGRDAIALQIQPSIDEARSYPKNTYAAHRGGIWRAMRSTEGMDGWECLLDGLHDVVERHIGEREIETRHVFASGKEAVTRRMTQEMIYRGVWRAGAFVRGDVVTWGGSTWHCNEHTEERPETVEGAKAWTLMTKRGDKGRDAASAR